MSKGAGKQTTTTQVDPVTQRMQQEVFDRAKQVAGTPYNPATQQNIAGVNGYTNQGRQGVQDAMGNYQNLGNQAFNLFGQGQGAADNFFGRLNGPSQAGLQPYQQAGAQGAAAAGGDPAAIARFMNPYQQQVIDQVGNQYDDLRTQAALGTNDAATRAGAFGGSRHAVMQGERMGQLDQGQAATTAGLLQSGYQNAMGQANQAAGMGMNANQLGLGMNQLGAQFGQLGLNALGQAGSGLGQAGGFAQNQQNAAQSMFGMGDYYRQAQQQYNDAQSNNAGARGQWDLRNLGALQGSLPGAPFGQTSSTPLTKNIGSSIIGGAGTGAAIGGPVGGLIGGGIGLLGGLF